MTREELINIKIQKILEEKKKQKLLEELREKVKNEENDKYYILCKLIRHKIDYYYMLRRELMDLL